MTILQTFLLLALYFFSKSGNPNLFREMTLEMNFGENLQFLLFLSTSFYLFFRARRAREEMWQRNYLMFWGLIFLLVALEEISWGQHFFRFELHAIQKLNNQGEVNMHNLINLHGKVWPYLLFSSVMFFLVPLIESHLSKRLSIIPLFSEKQVRLSFLILAMSYILIAKEENVFYYEYSELIIALIFSQSIVRKQKHFWLLLSALISLSYVAT